MRAKAGYSHGVSFPDPDGTRHGRGVRVWASGDRYDGEWQRGCPHGVGVVVKHRGGRFEGAFVAGQRTGVGRETWGNTLHNSFWCPMGHKHDGRGHCTYEGEYKDGHFHGRGCFRCLDGRSYAGTWQRGRRHGWGEQIMIPNSHRGDARRHHIGGVDALYRLVKYGGEWRGGQRHGLGCAEYSSGLKVCGELVRGRFDSTVKYVWPRNQGERLALFRHGTRLRWGAAGATSGLNDTAPSAKSLNGPTCDAAGMLRDLLGDDDGAAMPAAAEEPPKQLRWG